MKYLVLKPLHADLGGHLPGAEIPVGPGMGSPIGEAVAHRRCRALGHDAIYVGFAAAMSSN